MNSFKKYKIIKTLIKEKQSGIFNSIKEGNFDYAQKLMLEYNVIKNSQNAIVDQFSSTIYIIIISLTLFFIGLTLSFRTRYVNIELEVLTKEFKFKTKEALSFENQIPLSRIYLSHLDSIETEDTIIGRKTDPFFNGSFSQTGNNLNLNKFSISKNSSVTLIKDKNLHNIFLKDGKMSGNALGSSGYIQIDNNKWEFNIPPNNPKYSSYFEWNEKERFIPGRADFLIREDKREEFQISSNSVDSLYFLEEKISFEDNLPIVNSSIIGGFINIFESRGKKELIQGDNLIINIIDCENFTISSEEDFFRVSFKGLISKVKSGPRDFEQNLKPTLLEFLYYNKFLGIVWGGIIFVWGGLYALFKFLKNYENI